MVSQKKKFPWGTIPEVDCFVHNLKVNNLKALRPNKDDGVFVRLATLS